MTPPADSDTQSGSDPILKECPDCGGTDLSTADEVNDSMWDDTDTACHDCTLVFDARGRNVGGFDSDVAKELHSTMVGELKESLAENNSKSDGGEQ